MIYRRLLIAGIALTISACAGPPARVDPAPAPIVISVKKPLAVSYPRATLLRCDGDHWMGFNAVTGRQLQTARIACQANTRLAETYGQALGLLAEDYNRVVAQCRAPELADALHKEKLAHLRDNWLHRVLLVVFVIAAL